MDERRARGAMVRESIVQAITRIQTETGRPATYAEIMQLTGISSTGVLYYHIRILVREGRVQYQPGSRGLTVNLPLGEWHMRAINAIASIGQNAPVKLDAITRQLVNDPALSGLIAILLADLVRRGYVEQTGRGFVVITEPQT